MLLPEVRYVFRRRVLPPSLLTGIAAGVATGICAAHCYVLDTGVLLPAVWLAAALALSVLLCLFRQGFLSVAVATALTGALLDTLHWQRYRDACTKAVAIHAKAYEATVTDEPRHNARTSTMRATLHHRGALVASQVQLTTHRDTSISRGSRLLISGDLKPLRPALRPCFHLDTWLVHQGVVCRTFARRHAVLPQPDGAMPLRHRLLSLFRSSALGHDAEAVVEAMLLGSKNRLTDDLRQTYNDAGGSHLLALSGLHLSILTAVLMLLFTTSYSLRWLRLFTVAPLVWCYVWLTGAPPSLVRAATMMSVWLLTDTFGRHVQSSDALVFAALLLLTLNPFWLFDVGFQLSVTAVFGITAVPIIRNNYNLTWRPANRVARYIFNIVIISAVATVFTAPLVAVTFHRLPLWGWLMSVVYIPLTTIVILASLLLLSLLALGLPSCWLATAIDKALQLQLLLMRHTGAVMSDLYPSWLTVAASFALLLCFVYRRRVLLCFAAATLVISLTADRLIPVTPTVYFESGRATVVQSRRTIHRLPLQRDTTFYRNGLYSYGSITILRADGKEWRRARRVKPYPVDFLWVCHGFNGHIADLLHSVAPRRVVLDENLSPFYRQRFEQECDSLSLPHHDKMRTFAH